MQYVARGSEYNSFLTCRKQWLYQWIQQLEPKRPDGKLFFGTLFHKFLEHYYKTKCDHERAFKITQGFLWAADTSAMKQTELDDMWALFEGVSHNYHKKYYEQDRHMNVLGTEVEFLVRLEGEIYMTGTIDLIYELDGKIRFMDHKTVASLTMYEEKSKMDRQISRYWWALQQISNGNGLIKSAQTGEWVPWLAIQGKEIAGFDYNLIAKDFPKEPKVLKKGGLSQDKSQKTTFELYSEKIEELGLDLNDYSEMLEMLYHKPDQFLKRVDVLRTDAELESAVWEFFYTVGDMHDVRLIIMEHPEELERITYRNIGTHCEHMCNFTSLCKTTIEGGNVSLVKNLGYKKREEEKKND